MIFPQELKTLIELNSKFEFLGFFQRNKVKKLKKANMENGQSLRYCCLK